MACELESLRTHPSTTSMSALVREYPGFAWEVDPIMDSSPQLQEHTGISILLLMLPPVLAGSTRNFIFGRHINAHFLF